MDERTDQISSGSWDESALTSGSTEDVGENTEQLRADIEDTRAEMTQTINEIQERLSPDHLMGQVKETVREATIGKVERVMDKVGQTITEVTEPALEVAGRAGTAIKEAGTSVADSVWRNPIPVALIGLGIGMLFMRRSRGNGGDGYDATTRTRTPKRTDLIGQRDQLQKGQLQDIATRSTNTLSNLGTKAKESASAVTSRFGEVLRDNPLAVGAVAIAAGTAVGLVLPSTRIESEYIGETSERLVDKAEDVARDALNKVQDVATQSTKGH
jgi:ElaB/YqjD/DUF883 family membrane-anchored ribosome-binding protein